MVFDRGDGIYRGFLVALAGLALAGANPPSDNTGGQQAAAQGNKSAEQKKDIASGVRRIGEALEAQNAKSDPYEEERNAREIRDLQAQENSAYWAESMFWATLAAVVLSIVGVGLVWTTFRETRKANDINKLVAFRQLRAYVSAESAQQTETFAKGDDDGFLVVELKLHNSGSTPAKSVRVEFGKITVVGDDFARTTHTISVPDIGGQARQTAKLVWYCWQDVFESELAPPTTIEGRVVYQTEIPNPDGKLEEFSACFSIEPTKASHAEAVLVDIVRLPKPDLF